MFTGTVLWVTSLTAILLWPLQNAQHEGAHALMAKRYGAKITTFVVYPTGADNSFSLAFWRQGFTWAHMSWKGGEWARPGRAAISIAPQAANTLALIFLGAVRWFVESPVLVSILAGMALVQFIDGAWNLGTFYNPEPEEERKHTDGWSFQRHSDTNKWVCRVGAAAWHLAFGALLFLAW
jgi:hypothetical protein